VDRGRSWWSENLGEPEVYPFKLRALKADLSRGPRSSEQPAFSRIEQWIGRPAPNGGAVKAQIRRVSVMEKATFERAEIFASSVSVTTMGYDLVIGHPVRAKSELLPPALLFTHRRWLPISADFLKDSRRDSPKASLYCAHSA
jgi:hypothetical protein